MGKLRQTALILGEWPTEFFYFKSLCDVFKRLTIKPYYPKHTNIKELEAKILSAMESVGGKSEVKEEYPGWAYAPVSPTRDLLVEVFMCIMVHMAALIHHFLWQRQFLVKLRKVCQ